MFKSILAFFGFGWSKWQTIKEAQPMVLEQSNPITGYFSKGMVLVDVQRKENSLTGAVKYKNVIRS
jgi:hypothetical protein